MVANGQYPLTSYRASGVDTHSPTDDRQVLSMVDTMLIIKEERKKKVK